MTAAVLTGHGGNEVVSLVTQPVPQRRPGEILVRLCAAGLNRVDLYMRNSGAGIRHALPLVMGLDGAGEVAEAEPGSGLVPGDRVVIHPGLGCGACEFCLRGDTVLCTKVRFLGEHVDGTFRDFIALPARQVFPMPTGFSFPEAAALSVGHLTAWRMLTTQGRLRPSDTVLIFGIGGTVSLAALQLARAMGARVLVTSRHPDKLERARVLGADAGILGSEDIAARALELTGGRGVDMVIENVGQAVWPAALKSLVRGGRIVTCGATSGSAPSADLQRMFVRQLQVVGSTHGTLAEFDRMLAFVARHDLRPVVDSVHPLDQIHAALDRLEAGEQFGKISVSIC